MPVCTFLFCAGAAQATFFFFFFHWRMSAAVVVMMIVVVVISIEVESFFLAESLIRVGRYSAAVHFSSSSACCTPPATQDSQPMNVIRRKKHE